MRYLSSTSVHRSSRPQSIPVRQQDRQQTPITPQTKKSWVDDIVIEEDTPGNNLPVGYLGTFRGSRHFIPEYPGMLPCSHNTKHLLLCGHWVSSSEPCGSNCKKQNHAEKPFNCPTCQEIVREVLTGSILSAVESIRLRKLEEKGNSIVYVSCCVEQVVRAAPQIKTGITEAVAGLLLENYGRKCEQADKPDPEGLETIEWIVRDMQERTERKQRERFAQENPLNTHDKRKRPTASPRHPKAAARSALVRPLPPQVKTCRHSPPSLAVSVSKHPWRRSTLRLPLRLVRLVFPLQMPVLLEL